MYKLNIELTFVLKQ